MHIYKVDYVMIQVQFLVSLTWTSKSTDLRLNVGGLSSFRSPLMQFWLVFGP